MSPREKTVSGLQRTNVESFLRTVGTELRRASHFLDRGTPNPPAPHRTKPDASLLLAWPAPPSPSRGAVPQPSQGGGQHTAKLAGHIAEGRRHAPGLVRAGGPASVALAETFQQQPRDWHSQASGTATQGGGSGSSSSGESRGGENVEVAALLGMLLPQAGLPTATTEAADSTAAWQAAADCSGQQRHADQAAEAAAAAAEAAAPLVQPPRTAAHGHAAAAAVDAKQAAAVTAADGATNEQQRSRVKVLTWLGSIGSSLEEGPAAEAMPATDLGRQFFKTMPKAPRLVPAVSQAPAVQHVPKKAASWRRHPTHKSGPAAHPAAAAVPAYCAQLQPAGQQQRRLALARPPCHECNRQEAHCCCGSGGGGGANAAAPLRLLRPRQAGHSSPFGQHRQQAAACSDKPGGLGLPQGWHQQQLSGQPSGVHDMPAGRQAAASRAPSGHQQGEGHAFSIGSIHTAYFGGSQPQQPTAACQNDAFPATVPMAAAGTSGPYRALSSGCYLASQMAGSAGRHADLASGHAGLDMLRAYLAGRRQTTYSGPVASWAGSDPLSQLQAISRRVKGMQGDISSFLLHKQQHQRGVRGGAAAAAVASAAGAEGGGATGGQGQLRLGVQPRLARDPPDGKSVKPGSDMQRPSEARSAVGATGDQHFSSSTYPAATGVCPVSAADPFTDDFILSMQLGTDYNRLQQAALVTAAAGHWDGNSGTTGPAAAAAVAGGADGSGRFGGAVQRLKEAQYQQRAAAAVTAVRVGRQSRPEQRGA